jgi:hypothetical protein
MFHDSDDIVAAAEQIAKTGDVDNVLETLRQLCLGDFAELLLEIPPPSEPKFIPFILANPTD